VIARNLGLRSERCEGSRPGRLRGRRWRRAFNTPIAAVLFTLEEIMGDLHARVLGSVVLSSATLGWSYTWSWATILSSTWLVIGWWHLGNLAFTPCSAW